MYSLLFLSLWYIVSQQGNVKGSQLAASLFFNKKEANQEHHGNTNAYVKTLKILLLYSMRKKQTQI